MATDDLKQLLNGAVMNKKFAVFAAVTLSSVLSGCATVSAPERSISNNTIFSTKYPRALVQVEQELEYIGMVPESQWRAYTSGGGGTTQTSNQYIFVSADKSSVVDRSLIVSLWKLDTGYWIGGYDRQSSVELGKHVINGERFDTSIGHQVVPRDSKLVIFAEDSGYLLPSCVVAKYYQQVFGSSEMNRKNKMEVAYEEAIGCDKLDMLLPENQNTKRTKAFLEAFNEKADNAFNMASMQ